MRGLQTIREYLVPTGRGCAHWARTSRLAARRLRRMHRQFMVRYVDPARPRRYPLSVQIEATSKCNLRCPTCSRSREGNSGQHLTPDALLGLLGRLPWKPASVILSGIGEPLLCPHFFELVDILRLRGIRCRFYTNGTMLDAGKRESVLSRDNIVEINISCDGACRATFEGLRVGADFDRWQQFVRQFLADAKQRRAAKLTSTLTTVLSRQNIGELEQIVRLAGDLGFDYVGVLDPIPGDDTSAALQLSPQELAKIDQASLRKLARNLGMRIFFWFRRAELPPHARLRCMQPWENIFIRTGGEVVPCSALFGSEQIAVMGNLFEDDFSASWHGQRFREFREASAQGTNPLCRVCPYF